MIIMCVLVRHLARASGPPPFYVSKDNGLLLGIVWVRLVTDNGLAFLMGVVTRSRYKYRTKSSVSVSRDSCCITIPPCRGDPRQLSYA